VPIATIGARFRSTTGNSANPAEEVPDTDYGKFNPGSQSLRWLEKRVKG
jgi:hypothetical protein